MFSNMVSLYLKDFVLVLIMVTFYYNITTIYVKIHVIKSKKAILKTFSNVSDLDLDLQEISFEIHIDCLENWL